MQLLAFLKESKDAVEPLYYCLDLFGASNRVRDTWRKHGYDAISFDIKHNPSHDLCSEVGFKQLLEYGVKFLGLQGGKRGFDSCHSHLGHSFILVYLSFCDIYSRCLGIVCRYCTTMRLKNEGIVVAGPPCSMYSPCCSSVHRRTKQNPAGNLRNLKVRIAQRVWMNFAPLLQLWIWFCSAFRSGFAFCSAGIGFPKSLSNMREYNHIYIHI